MTVTRDLPVPERALAVGAHPDDIEFGAGATLAKWAARGCTVSLFVCTDGSKGTWDPHADPAELTVVRQREQADAASALGATGELLYGGWTDGELESGMRQRIQVAAAIRRLRPNVVLGHDPWKRYRLHPDHRHAGLLVIEALVAARDPHFFPELALPHHRPDILLLFEAEEPDHVEATDGHEAAKLAALEAHRSQFESTMKVGADPQGAELAAFRAQEHQRMTEFGALAGIDLGEAFKLIEDI